MVRGIEQFKRFFAGFEDNYVIIGGTACEYHEEVYALQPRATKDIDIILVVEALSHAFVQRFWEFVRAAQYTQKSVGTTGQGNVRHEYYRFKNPQNTTAVFPFQVELFSRSLGLMNIPPDAHITPIPTNEELSSLSAILMDDAYYNFTISHSIIEDGVHLANIECLIVLKAKAFIEMLAQRANGEQVDSRDIEKHKKDVFRLASMLAPAFHCSLPSLLHDHMAAFCIEAEKQLPNADFLKAAGIRNITAEALLHRIRESFQL